MDLTSKAAEGVRNTTRTGDLLRRVRPPRVHVRPPPVPCAPRPGPTAPVRPAPRAQGNDADCRRPRHASLRA